MSTINYNVLYTLIFILYVLPSNNIFTSSTAVHVWRGQIVYYGGDKEYDLKGADEACSNLGGKLPSVHSAKDIHELIHLIGQDARLWLGAKAQDNTLPTMPRGNYEWKDGTPFDYQGWVNQYPNCASSCCGVGFTTVYEDGMVDKECKSSRRLICILPVLTNATLQSWLNDQLETINSTLNSSNKTSILDIEQQLAIDILNETISNLQQSSQSLYSQLNILELTFGNTIKELNQTLVNNEIQLKRIMMNVKESVSQQRIYASQTSQQNQVDLDSLSFRVNICFVFLTFIIIILILAAMTKTNLLSWIPEIPKPNFYSRFVDSRINNLRSSTPTTIVSTPSNVRLEALYSEVNDNILTSTYTGDRARV